MKKVNVAVVGATGMVGRKMLEVLEERQFPIARLTLLASSRSAGKTVTFKGEEIIVEELNENSFVDKNIDYALFSAGGSISQVYAPLAVKEKVTVVDNSSCWRMDNDVPLVVPEVNAECLGNDNYLIANPNCSTIQSVLPLKVIDNLCGLKRVVFTTFQAVSGAGVKGVADLENKTTAKFPYPIHNNVLPHIDEFTENGYTKEEIKMIEETRKILGLPTLPVTATTVRVPIKNTHAISINIECQKAFDLEEVVAALRVFPGLKVIDAPNYPLAQDVDGEDDVYIGRIRRDESVPNGLNLWCVGDNIRKGAATNTVQIAEAMLKIRDKG